MESQIEDRDDAVAFVAELFYIEADLDEVTVETDGEHVVINRSHPHLKRWLGARAEVERELAELLASLDLPR